MSDDPLHLLALAQRVSDGRFVEWDEAARSADSDDVRELVEGLKLLERVALVHSRASSQSTHGVRRTWLDSDAVETVPTVWGPLRIVEPIGRGSFSTVYRAWDSRLERHVALKLIAPSRSRTESDSPAGRSIIEEGRLMARVRHPGVVTVYGAEEFAGRVGIWMELLEGRTLEAEVQASGPLPAPAIGQIGRQLAEALAAVHHIGLIHRDVKAQNVMRESDGRIVLMDFGAGIDPADPRATALAGTPLYLAPEVIEGGPPTPQSDVYGLGVLIYRLATGSFPVRGESLREVRRAHVREERRAVAEVRPDLPRALSRVIDTALSVDPSNRYAHAGEMAAAIRRLERRAAEKRRTLGLGGIAAAMLAIGAVASWVWLGGRSAASRLDFEPRDFVVVSRFENRTGDSVFDGAIEQALERELRDSRVVGLASSERVRDALVLMRLPQATVVDSGIAREIAIRDGGIKTVVTGSIARDAEGYVLTAELVRPVEGNVAVRFSDRATTREQVIPALARLGRKVRESLGEQLAEPTAPKDSPQQITTRSLRAFQLYNETYALGLEGRWAESVTRARDAVTEDPDFASAWLWIGWGLSRDPATRESAGAEILSASERALALSDSIPQWERDWIRGTYHLLRRDYTSSASSYKALLDLRPDHYVGAANLSLALLSQNRQGDANALFARIADLRPLDPEANARAAGALLAARHGVAAARPYVERARRVVLEAPSSQARSEIAIWITTFDAYADWQRRDVAAAQRRLDQVVADYRQHTGGVRMFLAHSAGNFYLSLGQIDRAEQVLGLRTDLRREQALLAIPATRQDAKAMAGLLRLLEKQPWFSPLPMFYVTAGRIDDARRLISTARPADKLGQLRFDAASGRIALLDGKPGEALGILEPVLRGLEIHGPNLGDYHRACRDVAEALAALSRSREAIDELQRCVAEEPVLGPPRIGFFGTTAWISARLALADLYRREQRSADVQTIESDLRALLAVADGDHPHLRKLNGSSR